MAGEQNLMNNDNVFYLPPPKKCLLDLRTEAQASGSAKALMDQELLTVHKQDIEEAEARFFCHEKPLTRLVLLSNRPNRRAASVAADVAT
jgi:hypothetical protein